MQLKSLEIINKFNKKNKIEHNKNTQFYHLIEEIGELARELSKEQNDWRKEGFNKEKLAEELIDVLDKLLVLANDYNIDLEKEFEKKYNKLKKRFEL